MASVSRQPNGRRTIQFIAGDGRRRSIRLGKVSHKSANTVRGHVAHLASAKIIGDAPPDETARWVARLDDVLYGKLATAELVPKREAARLGSFIDGYIDGRSDAKDSTRLVYGHTRRCLIDYFGPDKLLRDITPGATRISGDDGWQPIRTLQIIRCGDVQVSPVNSSVWR